MGDDGCCYCWTPPTGLCLFPDTPLFTGGSLAWWPGWRSSCPFLQRAETRLTGAPIVANQDARTLFQGPFGRLLACDHPARGWNRNFMSCPRRTPGQHEQDST